MQCASETTLAIVLGLLTIQALGQDISQHNITAVLAEEKRDGKQFADSLNGFGYRLMMKILEENNTSNVVISPVGIYVLMAMALLGSTGRTYNEIAEMLGFSYDILENRKHHEEFGQLLSALNDTSTETLLADALFVDKGTRLRDLYRRFLSHVYRGDALYTDFADGNKATQMINEWVKAHTKGKIINFLSDNLPPSTKLVLLNALYFRGQWTYPFSPNFTTKMTFHAPAKLVTSDLMLNFGKFQYISCKNNGLEMIALPYNDNVTTMYILKPNKPKHATLLNLLKTMDFAKIDNMINEMTNEKVVVRFPKMNIKSNINLERFIKLLGAPSMFNPMEANFALMVEGQSEMRNNSEEELISKTRVDETELRNLADILDELPSPGLHVDSIVQEVNININEFGTEATVVTAASLVRTAKLFYVDTPFLMFIRNEKTKIVTFSAVIFDPTDNIF